MPAAPDLDLAAERLERRFGLDVLWLFGSRASGAAREDSDLDLAALFRRRPSPLELLEAQAELGAELAVEVDLIDLDGAADPRHAGPEAGEAPRPTATRVAVRPSSSARSACTRT